MVDPNQGEGGPESSSDGMEVNPAVDTNSDESTAPKESSPSPDFNPRQTVGKGMQILADTINENLIAARYVTLASIGLLAAYGISQTPLFSRYRTVSEIPARYFTERRTLTGRLMVCRRDPKDQINSNNNNNNNKITTSSSTVGVTCFVRHLSPVERLLSKSWLAWLLKVHPAATLQKERPEESAHELLRVQVAGLVYPSSSSSSSLLLPEQDVKNSSSNSNSISWGRMDSKSLLQQSQPKRDAGQEWLHQLAEDRVVVKCKLLGRIVQKRSEEGAGNNGRSKRPIALDNVNLSSTTVLDDENQVAVAYVHYYPQRHPVLGADLGTELVRLGLAIPSPDGGLYAHSTTAHVVDATKDLTTLRKDAAYVKRLESAEYEACLGSYGVWFNPEYRASRSDVVNEVDFQQNASIVRKAWRWLQLLRR